MQPAQPSFTEILGQIVPMFVIMAVVLYLFVIMPQKRRQKEADQLHSSLKKGDRVLTSAGMYGEIVAIQGDVYTIKIADNTRVEFARNAIVGRADAGAKDAEKKG